MGRVLGTDVDPNRATGEEPFGATSSLALWDGSGWWKSRGHRKTSLGPSEPYLPSRDARSNQVSWQERGSRAGTTQVARGRITQRGSRTTEKPTALAVGVSQDACE